MTNSTKNTNTINPFRPSPGPKRRDDFDRPTHNSAPSIKLAKRLLPLPDLMAQLGDDAAAKKSARCPFHDDHAPSLSMFRCSNGGWFLKCFAGCGHGDEVDYLQAQYDVTKGAAIKRFVELAKARISVAWNGGAL